MTQSIGNSTTKLGDNMLSLQGKILNKVDKPQISATLAQDEERQETVTQVDHETTNAVNEEHVSLHLRLQLVTN